MAMPAPNSKRPRRGYVCLVFNDGRKIPLLRERPFSREEIPGLFPSTGDPAVAVCRENPADPNVLGLTNCSRTNWLVTMPDGRRLEIEPQKSVRLTEGMVLGFGAQTQAQVQPLSSGAAFMAKNKRTMGIGLIVLVAGGAIAAALLKQAPAADDIAAIAEAKKSVFYVENSKGSGSGFFIDAEGHGLTNHHVTGDDKTVKIILQGGVETTADVIKTDEKLDVSLLAVKKPTGTFLPMLSVNELKAGQTLYTIGYPLGSEVSVTDSSVSKGIYSGLRKVSQVFEGLPCYPDSQIVQTDANINHGNSGGAIVTADGKLVAISRLIKRDLEVQPGRIQAVTGLNYGIPIDEVRKKFLPGTPAASLATP